VNDLFAASVPSGVTASRTFARTVSAALVLTVAPLSLSALGARPATAHGALTNPVSRAAACRPESPTAGSAACRAAVAAGDGQAFADWDNLRVANVDGRDREEIPDGKLCSGGIDRYRGLDLPRADWPATRLRAGTRFTFSYRETIPHRGTFRLYVTRDGYPPTQPLRWSDLESRPFLTVTDPPLRDDAYVFSGRLPQAKAGRHIIYTIWQNSSTADTYYSCSDVVFTAPPSVAAPPKPATSRAPAVAASPATASPVGSQSAPAGLAPARRLSASDGHGGSALPIAAVAALAVLAAAGLAVAVLSGRGTARSGRRRPGRPRGRPDWTS
jgi:predicted carbohydrate-binding protein with CBM5 and CBM33 domain